MTNPTAPTRRVALAALWLALACAPLCGCAHLPWLHRAPGAPRAARVRYAQAAPSSPAPRQGVEPRELAARHIAADSLALAESELRALLARDPGDATSLSLLSKVLYRLGRHAEALALLEPVRARPDAFPTAARRTLLAGLALHQDALGHTQDARDAIAAALDANDASTLPAAVYVTLRGEAPDSAAGPAVAALHRGGKSATNLNNYGITRLRAGDVDAGRRAFNDAIARDPSLPGPYYNLAILEKFYRFDDTAAAHAFAAYWDRSHADPDSLRAAFPADLASVPVSTGGRP